MGKTRNDVERKAKRQQEAFNRWKVRESLTDEEQLARLEDRGHGDCEEARSLRLKITLASGKVDK